MIVRDQAADELLAELAAQPANERSALRVLKSDPSGDVFAADVELAGTTVPVIIKRPKRKVWWRYVLDVARPARARRTWIKAWKAIVRNLPTEWPLLVVPSGNTTTVAPVRSAAVMRPRRGAPAADAGAR